MQLLEVDQEYDDIETTHEQSLQEEHLRHEDHLRSIKNMRTDRIASHASTWKDVLTSNNYDYMQQESDTIVRLSGIEV